MVSARTSTWSAILSIVTASSLLTSNVPFEYEKSGISFAIKFFTFGIVITTCKIENTIAIIIENSIDSFKKYKIPFSYLLMQNLDMNQN